MKKSSAKTASKQKTLITLDTHAIFNYLWEELGHNKVVNYLQQAKRGELTLLLNEINLGEVYYVSAKRFDLKQAKMSLQILQNLPIDLIPVNQEFILSAAHWKATYPISYADAFALETAHRHQCPLLTGDPEFDKVGEIEIIHL